MVRLPALIALGCVSYFAQYTANLRMPIYSEKSVDDDVFEIKRKNKQVFCLQNRLLDGGIEFWQKLLQRQKALRHLAPEIYSELYGLDGECIDYSMNIASHIDMLKKLKNSETENDNIEEKRELNVEIVDEKSALA